MWFSFICDRSVLRRSHGEKPEITRARLRRRPYLKSGIYSTIQPGLLPRERWQYLPGSTAERCEYTNCRITTGPFIGGEFFDVRLDLSEG